MNQLETPELKQLLRLKEKENNICKASKKKKSVDIWYFNERGGGRDKKRQKWEVHVVWAVAFISLEKNTKNHCRLDR